MVTSLAANNYELQCNLVCNGVLWSLLLFCFEYDYTLDESGVEISDKSNQQQVANNLAKMAVLACIALSGYGLEPTTDNLAKSTDNDNIKSGTQEKPKLPTTTSSSSTSSTYTQNAQNPLQNASSKQLAITGGSEESSSDATISNEKSDISPTESEKENIVNNQKYIITTDAKNSIVKQVLDKLLTEHISNKLAKVKTSEVSC